MNSLENMKQIEKKLEEVTQNQNLTESQMLAQAQLGAMLYDYKSAVAYTGEKFGVEEQEVNQMLTYENYKDEKFKLTSDITQIKAGAPAYGSRTNFGTNLKNAAIVLGIVPSENKENDAMWMNRMEQFEKDVSWMRLYCRFGAAEFGLKADENEISQLESEKNECLTAKAKEMGCNSAESADAKMRMGAAVKEYSGISPANFFYQAAQFMGEFASTLDNESGKQAQEMSEKLAALSKQAAAAELLYVSVHNGSLAGLSGHLQGQDLKINPQVQELTNLFEKAGIPVITPDGKNLLVVPFSKLAVVQEESQKIENPYHNVEESGLVVNSQITNPQRTKVDIMGISATQETKENAGVKMQPQQEKQNVMPGAEKVQK